MEDSLRPKRCSEHGNELGEVRRVQAGDDVDAWGGGFVSERHAE